GAGRHGEAADRVLRFHPHVRARARDARLAAPHARAPPEVRRGRLARHGEPDHRRDARHVCRDRDVRELAGEVGRALRGVAGSDRALSAVSTESRRSTVARRDPRVQWVTEGHWRQPEDSMADLYDLGERPAVGEVPARMHAYVVRQSRFGQPRDAWKREIIPTPSIGADEALIYVMASGINYNNVWAALGTPLDVIAERQRL